MRSAIVTFSSIPSTPLYAEYAQWPDEQERGLAGRESMPMNEGMAFPLSPAMTMRGMNFPLDFIYVRDHVVVGINDDVAISAQIVTPPAVYKDMMWIEMDYTIEVNAGYAQMNGIQVGDRVWVVVRDL